MREVGIADSGEGLAAAFDKISLFSQNCKYKDCTHRHENGCAVIEGVEKGEIDRRSYENYLKMQKEKEHFESSIAERRKKDKELSKIVKNYKKVKKRNKFLNIQLEKWLILKIIDNNIKKF